MSLKKISLIDLKIDSQINFDIFNSNNTLLLKKNTIFTQSILEKLSDIDLYIESVNNMMLKVTEKSVKESHECLKFPILQFSILNRDSEGAYTKLECEYVGLIKNTAFIIEMPVIKKGSFSQVQPLDPGQKIKAVIKIQNDEYIFESYVMYVINHPTHCAFIKYPSVIKLLRKGNKFLIFPVQAFIRSENSDYSVNIINFEKDRLTFVSAVELPESSYLNLNFQDATYQRIISIKNPCVLIKATDTYWEYSVTLTNLLDADQSFIDCFKLLSDHESIN